MKCPYCGNETPDESLFCNNCGSAIAKPKAGDPFGSEIPVTTPFNPAENAYAANNAAVNNNAANNVQYNPQYNAQYNSQYNTPYNVCRNCGSALKPGANWCDVCGAPVGAAAGVNAQLRANASKGKEKALIAVACVVLVCIIAALVIIGVYKFKSASNTDTAYEQTDTLEGELSLADLQTPAPIVITPMPVTPAPAVAAAPVFTSASASSIRGTDTEGGEYAVDSVLSKDPMTKWVPKKDSNGGIDEWVQVSASTLQTISGVAILNGYHKSEDIWRNNNRVQKCTLSFSNGEVREFTLNDTMDLIQLDLGETIETYYIKLTIKSVYGGTKWNDTAITYLGAY